MTETLKYRSRRSCLSNIVAAGRLYSLRGKAPRQVTKERYCAPSFVCVFGFFATFISSCSGSCMDANGHMAHPLFPGFPLFAPNLPAHVEYHLNNKNLQISRDNSRALPYRTRNCKAGLCRSESVFVLEGIADILKVVRVIVVVVIVGAVPRRSGSKHACL